MEIVRDPRYVEDIWSGLTLVETDHATGAEAAVAERDYWTGNNICWIYLVGAHVCL